MIFEKLHIQQHITLNIRAVEQFKEFTQLR